MADIVIEERGFDEFEPTQAVRSLVTELAATYAVEYRQQRIRSDINHGAIDTVAIFVAGVVSEKVIGDLYVLVKAWARRHKGRRLLPSDGEPSWSILGPDGKRLKSSWDRDEREERED